MSLLYCFNNDTSHVKCTEKYETGMSRGIDEKTLKLTIHQVNIKLIHNYELKCLINLTSLHLTQNMMKIIPMELFSGLTNLRELNLSENNISHIGSVCNLEIPESLNLSSNHISTVQNQSFYNVTKLQILDISKNKIKLLHRYMFEHLHNLAELYLQWNKINWITPYTFKNNCQLKILYLGGNQIRNMKPLTTLFIPLEKLQIK